jgi:hypothetical protein
MNMNTLYYVSMTDRFRGGCGRVTSRANKLVFKCDSYYWYVKDHFKNRG